MCSLSSLLHSKRIDDLKNIGLSFACQKSGHLSKLCRYRARFRIRNRCHLTVLHFEHPVEGETRTFTASTVKTDVRNIDIKQVDTHFFESHIGTD